MNKLQQINKFCLEKLARVTANKAFIPEIDGLRFFAIITVVIYHLNTAVHRASKNIIETDFFSSIIHKGSLGVSVFFAISGFILSLPFAQHYLIKTKKVNIKDYFLRRLTRLEPPYILILGLFFVAQIILGFYTFGQIFPNLIASLFYVHSIIYNKWSIVNPVAWSLEVEVQFYILAPLLATLFAIKNRQLRRIVILLLIVIGAVLPLVFKEQIEFFHLRKSIFVYFYAFFAGFLFTELFVQYRQFFTGSKVYWADGLGIMAVIILFLSYHVNDSLIAPVIFSLAIVVFFVAVFKGVLFNYIFTRPWIATIGGMCYTIYLIHYALIIGLVSNTKFFFLTQYSLSVNVLIQAIIILPILFLVSALFFVAVEKPCMYKDWPAQLKNKVQRFFYANY
ncbi:Peptidoglycan/LPS O-acetylase OafA/YrhL, contains acyltransferase and SGNH-hydrolase domains [Flexibacter flexilis DSM 6793]|uniref:Peptidoglycan/LPS O-acetylase OafA/YrhL, contains acyltransferase and SGNH-hydrolase domains n=1 Tax=Flexibacter flexilis DSM 6793 TaxID=927664 RepID=A0A1I1FQD4_9BACT|nr:acyltransferase [Flexibacter flexilis]SFB99293.1 Peptidoglycan/LPS O-acetylase OafA/YrhL, contains acyltransferase and SGNH-hydrolase domains [Flexibacter flexilis DSM 6793]